MEVSKFVDFLELPIELVSYILIFLDINYEKKITYYNEARECIRKTYYIPSKLCLINKKWYSAILYSKCKGCLNGRYDILKKKCQNCGHILEDNATKRKRLLILNKYDNHKDERFSKDTYINDCINLMKKLKYVRSKKIDT